MKTIWTLIIVVLNFSVVGNVDAGEEVVSFEFDQLPYNEFLKAYSGGFGLQVYAEPGLRGVVTQNLLNIQVDNAINVLRYISLELGIEVIEEDGFIVVRTIKENIDAIEPTLMDENKDVLSRGAENEKTVLDETNQEDKVGKESIWGKWLPKVKKDSENAREIEFKWFTPRARYYFDTGTDDDGEIDIFKDGSLTPTIDLVSIYYPWDWEFINRLKKDDWQFGPSFGLGITAPAGDSNEVDMDGVPVESASSAPVVLLSAGLELNVPLGKIDGSDVNNNTISIEAGYAIGFSTEESLDDKNDSAIYVGIGYSWKQGKKTKESDKE